MTDETQAALETATAAVQVAGTDAGTVAVDAATDVAHDSEREVRKGFWALLDEAKADAEKGLAWLEVELKKL